MLATGLSIILFSYWWLTGYSVLTLLYSQRNSVQNMLFAPVIGLAITVIFIFTINRIGVPVAEFSYLLLAALLLFSLIVLCYFRPIVPFKRYWPFILIFIFALCLTGRPLIQYGFNWLSYANDDMANYCLGAMRFLHHGYSALPDLNILLHSKDYSLYYWFMFVPGMMRSGSELLLAWVSGCTKLMPDQIFMPVMISLYLTLISATGALVYQSKKYYAAACMSCLLLAMSALTSLSVYYQLIAQLGGISVLIGCVLLLLRPYSINNFKQALKYGLLLAICIDGLMVIYPEVFPFLALAVIIYLAINVIQKRFTFSPFTLIVSIAAIITIILLNKYILNFVLTMLDQIHHGFKSSDIKLSLFPYFLVPSGFADLWGLQAIANLLKEPLQSLTILIGIILTLLTALAALRLAKRSKPYAILTVVMLVLACYLFIRNNDFGLFKLALYIQPFMLITMVVAWFELVKHKHKRYIPLILLAISGLYAQQVYLYRSVGIGITDVPDAAVKGINQQFKNLLAQIPVNTQLIADTNLIVLAKLQALYANGREIYFPSRSFFMFPLQLSTKTMEHQMIWKLTPDLAKLSLYMKQRVNSAFPRLIFNLHDPEKPYMKDGFYSQSFNINKSAMLLASTTRQTIFNRRNALLNVSDDMIAVPWKQAHNHLIFTNSDLGQHYYLPDTSHNISVNQLQNDYYYPGKTFQSLGRYLLFRVVNPTDKIRFVIEASTTLNNDGNNQLPPAAAIGTQRLAFPLVGRGSARVFSPPIQPQMIAGNPYLAIDMGSNGIFFPVKRTGLMRLYGDKVYLDRRQLVGYFRDISLVTDSDYQNLTPPVSLQIFPQDLANPNLEYSGIYEDGWLSDQSYLMLTQPKTARYFVMTGDLPLWNKDFNTQIKLSIDNKTMLTKILHPGQFQIKIPVTSAAKVQRIDITFSRYQHLPVPDKRPATVKLQFIGFISQ